MRNRGVNFEFDSHEMERSEIYEGEKVSVNPEKHESLLQAVSGKGLLKEICQVKFLKVVSIMSFVTNIQSFFFGGAGYSGFVYFMPEFLQDFSKVEAYIIILIQISLSIPGVLSSSYLSESSFGRKYTGFLGFFTAGLLFLPFYFPTNRWMVIFM